MKIDYENYKVYRYTINKYLKTFPREVLLKYGNQLAFLYQNGFCFNDTPSIENIEEQFSFYNDFTNYEDFIDLKKLWRRVKHRTFENGYKILDCELDFIIDDARSIFHLKNAEYSEATASRMLKNFETIKSLIFSKDEEIVNAVENYFDVEKMTKYINQFEQGSNALKLIVFQKMYETVFVVHKKLNVKLSHSKANEMLKSGNINDELYGSAGSFNPLNNKIVICGGSAVSEIKKLIEGKMDNYDILLLAKEAYQNDNSNKVLADFIRRAKSVDFSTIEKVRRELISIDIYGILILLELKHNLSLFDNDTKNNKKAFLIFNELQNICNFVGYDIKNLSRLFE